MTKYKVIKTTGVNYNNYTNMCYYYGGTTSDIPIGSIVEGNKISPKKIYVEQTRVGGWSFHPDELLDINSGAGFEL